MPKFIKMGLGGTGYLGHQESSLRSARKRAARRKISEGYPKIAPLSGRKELVDYFSGDRITCLLCGRAMRTLAAHVQRIHGISAESYKERYGIPQVFTLSCQATSELHSAWAKHAIESGIINLTQNQAALARSHITRKSKRQWSKKMLAQMLDGDDKPKKSARGSPEFHEKMQARPQCQPDVVADRFSRYWKGRKQSPEHVKKRLRR